MIINETIYDVIVVGMGAGGLFALANIDAGVNAIGLEAGKSAGRKLLVTGGGRCNLSNTKNIKEFVNSYDKPAFVRPILYSFNNQKLIEWFEQRGFPLVEEEGKVYPKSQNSQSVLNCFLSEIENKKHKIFYSQRVLSYSTKNKDYVSVETGTKIYLAKKLILAVGGATHPNTGSDGKFLEENFKVVPFKPALSPIYIRHNIFSSLRGTGIKNVSISYSKKIFTGDLLFAGKFLSGPVIMDLSNYVKEGDSFPIDFLPTLSKDKIKEELFALLAKSPKKLAKTVLEDYCKLPNNLVDLACSTCFDLSTKSANIKKLEIIKVVDFLKSYTVEVKHLEKLKYATVSSGGVPTSLINGKTMALKTEDRVKIIGEAIDVVGKSGGYNLQFAFSSAMRALV